VVDNVNGADCSLLGSGRITLPDNGGYGLLLGLKRVCLEYEELLSCVVVAVQ
jgi:hypothetical protein